jgi:hypothetical protein
MRIKNWLVSIVGRVPSGPRLAQDMQVFSSKAREKEPWYRHKERRPTKISLKEKIIILLIAGAIILLCLFAVGVLTTWILGW